MNRLTRLFIWGFFLVIVGWSIGAVQLYEIKKLIYLETPFYWYILRGVLLVFAGFIFLEGTASIKYSIHNKE